MEIYKEIDGYNGYFVSNKGNVKSVKKNFKDVILKPRKTWSGYLRVALWKNNKQKDFSIHRLVAEAFLSNPLNKPQVNHKNGIKTDNKLINLEWNTMSENMIHSYAKGRNKRGSKVVRIGKVKKIYNSIVDASLDNNVSRASISQCLSGKSKTSAGYKWEYYGRKSS